MSDRVIYLSGSVGASFWDEECFTAKNVRDQLAEFGPGDIEIRINSGGGIVSEGQAIYNALRMHSGSVRVVIDGVAASAASLIAMAGDQVVMPAGSIMMIHDPATFFTPGRGTEEDHAATAKALGIVANAVAGIYARRAKISVDDAREIMRAETWFDGDAAIAAGFADATEEAPAAEAAMFDYQIYANAPAAFANLGVQKADRKPRELVVAMIAAAPAFTMKGQTMKTDQTDLEDQETDGEEMPADPPAADPAPATDPEPDPADPAETGEDDEEEETPATPVAAQILDLVMAQGQSPEMAADMMRRRLTLTQATAEIQAALSQEIPQMKTTGQRAHIVRDERETMAVGMSSALMHMIGGVGQSPAQDGNAARFANMSIVEMAATASGYKGPLRTAHDRVQAMHHAFSMSHSVADFPRIFDNVLGKILLERYQSADPTYRRIARRRDLIDFRPASMVRPGDFPKPVKVPENGKINFGTFSEGAETMGLTSYASGIWVSMQMLINDDLGAIEEVISDAGAAVAAMEEEVFYATALNPTLSDTKALFHADHGNLAASGTAITVAALGAGRAAMQKATGSDGRKLNISPSILLVSPDKLTEAEQMVASVVPAQNANVNPFSGKLTPESSAELSGNAWYLIADPARNSPYRYGYLNGATGPTVRRETPFGQQGLGVTVETFFAAGAVGSIGAYKNAGA